MLEDLLLKLRRLAQVALKGLGFDLLHGLHTNVTVVLRSTTTHGLLLAASTTSSIEI